MTTDSELLRRYAETKSEAAFAELVQRHVNLVYSAALRQVNGDAHLAQDVAQTVFTDLARKAASLSRRATLIGWFYTSAHFAAAKIVRGEHRRRNREEQFMREPTHEPASEADWEKLQPTLDSAMHELKEADREAILWRYFENRQFAEVGAKLGLNENTARMRVERALKKLRTILAKRGIAATATLASALSANAVQLAPASLAATLATATLAGAGTGTITLWQIMTATKLKLGLSALVVAGAATALVVQHQTQQKLRAENESLTQQLAQLQTDSESLSNRLVAVGDSQKLTGEQLSELLKLRGETRLLKSQLAAAKDQAPVATRSAQTNQAGDPDSQQRDIQMRKLRNAKNLTAAAMLGFAGHHEDNFPTNWDQTAGYFDESERSGLNPGDAMPDTTADFIEMTNLFALAYQGSISNLYGATNFHDLIVVRERQPWQLSNGKWAKVYGFADGHSQIQSEPPEGFDSYEQNHMMMLPPSQ